MLPSCFLYRHRFVSETADLRYQISEDERGRILCIYASMESIYGSMEGQIAQVQPHCRDGVEVDHRGSLHSSISWLTCIETDDKGVAAKAYRA